MANPALHSSAKRAETLPPVFRRYKSDISAALKRSLAADGSALYDMLRYSMGWSDENAGLSNATEGKALRPTLCLLACEATGGTLSEALPAAVSLELIHNFSLIHDDIQDRDRTRHHRPTLWAMWGAPKALVAGNTLRVIADMSLWRLIEEGAPFELAVSVTRSLTEAYLEMIDGQYLDLSYEGRPDIGLSEYLDMISKKTGALVQCALCLGALIGSRDRATVLAYRECGRALGLVFQIRDDILGIWGDEDATGKPVGADIQRRKSTLPVVFAASQARTRDKKLLSDIYGGEACGDEDVATVLDIMETVRAREYAQDLAAEQCERALDSLSTVELAPRALQDMEEVAHFLLVRQH